MTHTSVRELAEKLAQALITDKRNDGQEFTKLRDGSPEWMTEVIHEVHGEKMPDDYTYKFIRECAVQLADYPVSDYASYDLSDAINQIEPDIYTYDLTRWLGARADHYQYCDEAIQDGLWQATDQAGRANSIITLLQVGQSLHIQEVGYALIAALEKVDTED